MEKRNNTQLELFSQKQKIHTQTKRERYPFFSYIKYYEKSILIIIGFVFCGIISFSLGVERGKKLSITNLHTPTPVSPKVNVQATTASPTIKDILGENYTIQVASFQSKESAEREASSLKKAGFLTLVLVKGKYTVLCVGNFSNRDSAKSFISQLKRRYQDCFIRRL